MSFSGAGFLIVLSDVKAEDERDYLGWLTTEHVQERLGVPGFLAVRIFRRAMARGHRYFIWYRLADTDVVDSPAYLARLNDPTPWSQRIMPVLKNFGRGGGKVAASSGGAEGNFIEVIELSGAPADAAGTMETARATAAILSAHVLVTDRGKSAIETSERALRTSDNTFSSLLIAEANNESAMRKLRSLPLPAVPADTSLFGGGYREVFSLANS